jgi:hypothetical protein
MIAAAAIIVIAAFLSYLSHGLWVSRFAMIEGRLEALRVEIESLRFEARAGREMTSSDLTSFPPSPGARPN